MEKKEMTTTTTTTKEMMMMMKEKKQLEWGVWLAFTSSSFAQFAARSSLKFCNSSSSGGSRTERHTQRGKVCS